MAQSPIPPREREVIRAIIKALRTGQAKDMQALSSSYGVSRKINRVMQSADLLEALIDGQHSRKPEEKPWGTMHRR